jgi:hypothetical protein
VFQGPAGDLTAINDSDPRPCILARTMGVQLEARPWPTGPRPRVFRRRPPGRAESLYIDLTEDPDHPPQPIHLGFRGGRNVLFGFLDALRRAGVHHVILNFRYGARDAGDVLEEIGREVLPQLEATQPPAKAAE